MDTKVDTVEVERAVFTCDLCGMESEHASDVTVLRSSDGDRTLFVCENCIAHEYRVFDCDNCGETRVGPIERNSLEQAYCLECYSHSNVCEDCDMFLSESETYYDDDNGYTLCHSCWQERIDNQEEDYNEGCSLLLKDYGDKPEPRFHGTTSSSALFIGFELEVVSEETYKTVVIDDLACINVTEDSDIYFKRDSSLGSCGFEIVSHPMTPSYIEDYRIFEKISDVLRNRSVLSHDAMYDGDYCCGLHFHVNRSFFHNDRNAASKIASWFYANRDEIAHISRRTPEQLDEWAKVVEFEYSPNSTYNPRNRSVAVNIQPEETIEFRFFRGNIRADRLKQSAKFIERICKLANALNYEQLAKMSPKEVYDECA